jgi:hypothetical protein
VWLIILSDQLPVLALVSFYLTNKLMGRRLVLQRPLRGFPAKTEVHCIASGISDPFKSLSQTEGLITHVLRTRAPLTIASPFDLHVLGPPQTFALSQDQTLQFELVLYHVGQIVRPADGCRNSLPLGRDSNGVADS